MNNRLSLWLVVIVFLIGIEVVTVNALCGGAYTNGNWLVTTPINCSNEVIPVSGTLTVQDISEVPVLNFSALINSAVNLKQNSNKGIVPAIPDLNPATPLGYTPDWDTDPLLLFSIVMNESDHLLQVFMTQPGAPVNISVSYYIDTDASVLTGCTNPPSPVCPANTGAGSEVLLQWLDPDGPGPGPFSPQIACWNSTSNVFGPVSAGPSGSAPCNFTGAAQNFTIYWNSSSLSMETVIDINGPWVDKPMVKFLESTPNITELTKFKNSSVNTAVGNLTLDNITLQPTGTISIPSGFFTVKNSNLTFGLTSNGSANMSWSGPSIIFINNSIITANSTPNAPNNWGWQVTTGDYTLLNNNFSYMGIDAITDGFNAATGGLIENNRFSNCYSPPGWCLTVNGPTMNLIFHNNTFLGAPSDALRITDGVSVEVSNNFFNSRLWVGGPSTNNLNINYNIFSQPPGTTAIDIDNVGSPTPPSNITFTNNNFTTTPGKGISDNVLAGVNTLVYSNAFGEIAWLNKGNLSFNGILNLSNQSVVISSNLLGLITTPNIILLNTSARLTFVGLNYTTQPKLLKDGVECSNTPAVCNITSWAQGSGTLTATVSNFSNYTTNTSIYGGGTSDCWSHQFDQSGCINAGCTYDYFTSDCRLNFESLTCNDFCGKCLNSTSCGNSTKSCQWNSGGFCLENFGNFTFGSGGNLSGNNWVNVSPPNCMSNPTQCDSMFDSVYNFVRFEGLCFDSVDNDVDGTTDCNDTDCYNAPECVNSYNSSADTTAPQVKNTLATPNNDSALISIVTNEPTAVKILFYNTSATCAILNKTFSDPNDPSTTLDDYMINHFFPIDNQSLSWTLGANLNYFYKINATDKAGNGYLSACSNFTTRSTATTFNLNFSGSGANGMQFDFGAGFVNYNGTSGLSVNKTSNTVMKFSNQPIEFKGIDLAQSSNFDFGNMFRSGNATAFKNKPYFGINSTTWQQMVQQLGVKNFTMQLSAADCNKIYRCNDNGSVCTDVTALVTCIRNNITHVNVTVSASLGFSSYIAGTNAQVNITDDTDSATREIGNLINFYANYTNTSNITLTPTGHSASCNFTSANLSLTNAPMTFNASGDGRWNYTASAFNTAGTYNWSVNCSATGYDTLNATDNATLDSRLRPNVSALIPALSSRFNASGVIEIAANASDNVGVSNVSVNITYPNGTIFPLNLSLTSGSKYNRSFTIPALDGLYNLTFFANDTSNNINSTEISNFTLDSTAPIITVASPIATTNDTPPDINISTNEVATCQYKSNSTSFANMTTTGGTSHIQNLSTALSVGDYTYFVRCNDTNGNLKNLSVPFIVTSTATNAANVSNFTITGNQTVTLVSLSNVNVTINLSRTLNSSLSIAEYNSTPNASFSLDGYSVSSFRFYSLNAEDVVKNSINRLVLSIVYNQTLLTAAGITETDLVMYYYNLTSALWQQESQYYVNTTSDTFTVNITHLSNFVLGTAAASSSSSSSSSSSGGGSGGASGSGWGFCGDTVCNDGEKCAPSPEVNNHKGTCYKDCGLCKVTAKSDKPVIANKTTSEEAPVTEASIELAAPETAPESLSEQLSEPLSTEKLDAQFWLSFAVVFIIIAIVFYLLEQKHKRARPDEPEVENKKKSSK